MSPEKMIAVLLLVVGVLALAYGGFTYTKDTHNVDVGPMHLSVAEKEHVNIPVWVGAGAVLIGGLMLVLRRGT